MTSRAPDLSLVLLTFNRWDRTFGLLESLLADVDDYGDVELVWVDNGSTDETRERFDVWLRHHSHRLAGVVRRFNDINHGFVVGVNEGLSLASGRHVCLINNDATVSPGWWSGLRPTLELPGVAAAGPVSDGMPWNQSLECHGRGVRLVPVVYGFCLVARRETFDRIGLLDERYGRGVIEVEDWCERAARAGFRFAVNTDVVVGHNEPHASYTPRVNAMLHIRNRDLFTRKWGVGPHYWGDRAAPRRRFARTVVRVLPDSGVDVGRLAGTLATLGPDDELLAVARHGDADHLGWLRLGRRDPRLNVVCVRPAWDAANVAALCRANARGPVAEVAP